ncbi:MAG: thioredoxin family protein [Bdellovibrionaceae bacterium]|nr:thioredoxin family protein [Pseudobdellovibrionaceae bacterium]
MFKSGLLTLSLFLASPSFSFTDQLGKSKAAEQTTDPLEVRVSSSPEMMIPKNEYTLQLSLQLPNTFHAYEDQFKIVFLEPSGLNVKSIALTPLKRWFDKFSKKERSGVGGSSTMTLIIETPDRFVDEKDKLVFEFTYQACSDTYCLFPKSKDVTVPMKFENILNSSPPFLTEMPKGKALFTTEGFTYFLGQSWWLALILAFLAGIITSFTPCIFPMIPITLAILNNHSEQRTRLTNFLISVVYVLGIATTYSTLGLVAAKSGMLFGSLLSNPYVLTFICSLFFLMALSMYGVFELHMPNFITQRFGKGSKHKGYLGAFLSGLFAGIVASPCVGPVLVSILTFVSTRQSVLFGFFLLFTYALGLGLIFILLGSSTELTKKLPRSGPWLETTKFILGSLMLVGFFYYFDLLVTPFIFQVVLGLILVVLASLQGAFTKPSQKKLVLVRKGFMQAVLVLGFTLIVSGVYRQFFSPNQLSSYRDVQFNKSQIWTPYSDTALAQAQTDKKPVIIDFFAEWCEACLQLEEFVFSTPEFKDQTQNMRLLKFDATKNSPQLDSLRKKYGIVGLPSILFIDSNGNWIKAKTLTEFEKKEAFFKRIEDLK